MNFSVGIHNVVPIMGLNVFYDFPKFEIFSDRIEITSYDGLPSGLSQKEFFTGYSAPRSKVLMTVYRDVGLVESLGIGIARILESYGRDCFDFSDHFLRICFPSEKIHITTL